MKLVQSVLKSALGRICRMLMEEVSKEGVLFDSFSESNSREGSLRAGNNIKLSPLLGNRLQACLEDVAASRQASLAEPGMQGTLDYRLGIKAYSIVTSHASRVWAFAVTSASGACAVAELEANEKTCRHVPSSSFSAPQARENPPGGAALDELQWQSSSTLESLSSYELRGECLSSCPVSVAFPMPSCTNH